MTEAAWDIRLGWTHGLISADPAERDAALQHHLGTRAAVHAALQRFNHHWWRTRANYRDPVFRQASAEHQAAQQYAFPEGLWFPDPLWNMRTRRDEMAGWPGLPYAINFLEWEVRHPEVWTEHAKRWGAKETLLRAVAAPGLGEVDRIRLTVLVELAVRRAYRCKDREYVRVARAIDSPDLRDRLAAAAASTDPWARLHATYVLDMLCHPERPNTRAVWRSHVEAYRC